MSVWIRVLDNSVHNIIPQTIIIKGPKENTLSDFWAMLWQEKVTQIVMLTNVKEGVKV